MATVYVSPTGNDANTYAQSQDISTRWAAIGHCQTAATTGVTLTLLATHHNKDG